MKDSWFRNRVAKSAAEQDTMDRVHRLLDEQLEIRRRVIAKFTGPTASDVNAPPRKKTGGRIDGRPIFEGDGATCKCGAHTCSKTKKRTFLL